MVWLKTRDPARQPPLRLAIEGRVNDRPYFRFARLGRAEDGSAVANESITPLRSDWGSQPYLFHVDDLPPAGLTELQVIFELAGAGEAWIDDVAVYDRWFHKRELDELAKQIGAASFNLESGNYGACERFLDSYWARFLLEHVSSPIAPRVAERVSNRDKTPVPRAVPESPSTKPADPSNWKKLVPKVPLKNPFQ